MYYHNYTFNNIWAFANKDKAWNMLPPGYHEPTSSMGGFGGTTMSVCSIGDYAHYTDDGPDIQRGDGAAGWSGRHQRGRPATMGYGAHAGYGLQPER